jgi:RNA polymerase sigma-70 factor (ECF subfamily)
VSAVDGATVPQRPSPATVSFDDLYEEHFAFVWRSLRRLGVRPALLDDAAQDSFLVAYRRLSDFVSGTSAKAWLFAIARRVASDYRRTERRKGGGLSLVEEARASTAPSPLDDAMSTEASDIVLRFLDGLDEDRRAAFVLSELEQMTAPEIGAALEVNVSTIYSRVRSARQAFTTYVDEHHPDAKAAANAAKGGGHG